MQDRDLDPAGWIRTYSGRMVTPMSLQPDMICVEDIAQALSRTCRYGGHVEGFLCPTEDELILTSDLRWIPAGDLVVGDKLIGFDEYPHELGMAGKRKRRLRSSVVTHRGSVKRETWLLEMSDGSTVKSSAEHPWLIATKSSGNQTWKTTSEIATDLLLGRKRYMHKFIEPWATRHGWEMGWLAGMADGEGCLSVENPGRGVAVQISQNEGPVLDSIVRRLRLAGYDTHLGKVGNKGSRVWAVTVKGGWRGAMSFLGGVRPERLLSKFEQAWDNGWLDKQLNNPNADRLEIVRAVPLGEDWVAGLETSTHTYICQGFGAHNSVAEHSVEVAKMVPDKYKLTALLHDASEAYLGDIPSPIKKLPEMAGWRAGEERAHIVIAEVFGTLYPHPPEVEAADAAHYYHEIEHMRDFDRGMNPGDALEYFLDAFWEYNQLQPDYALLR